MKTEKGFTLLELIITLVVLAVLAAIAAPSFGIYFEKSRLKGAADSVASLMALARGEAVKRDRGVNVSLGGTVTNWCVGANLAVDPAPGNRIPPPVACDCTDVSSCSLGVVDSANFPGVTSDIAAGDVEFNPKLGSLAGLATQQMNFTAPSGNYALQVNVNPIGHIRTCTPVSKGVISGYRRC